MMLRSALFLIAILLGIPASGEQDLDIEHDIHAEDSVWDVVKLRMNPKEYWQERVAELEDAVRFDESSVRDLVLERKRILATKDIDMAQAVNGARSLGLDPLEARRDAWEDIKFDLKQIKDAMIFQRAVLERDRKWLEAARKELVASE